MKLGFYYALVKNHVSGKREILSIQRESVAELFPVCYTRLCKEIEENHSGKYETSALAFGALKIEYHAASQLGTVWIGHTKVGIITPKATLISVGVEYPIGTFYLSPPPSLQIGDPELIQLRDVVASVIGDATWVMN
ncbi:hypothetical protein FDJ23_gp315 [Erwinia phage vB_EamM_Desertfox]|jgi:hypothetical protein|uniref:Uncharacterized protein n=5 Tax=Agricanvirus TaxID=1984776 RepID=A0A191ZCL9_9CAUD|nr:hypothetical protein FDH97_gp319 [Erwinia phage vB_EamM_Deimos-Minion]YP_009606101.1 hypothetical protein FDH99_gp208 [Erwinia phage vB_EamM_Simmy50]YP_009606422.1 hypothetical protein FDI00_gp316 [Erwinia phage vB_EamM_Special G]YP_009622056.1 hypothetical protein FDJ23_gp315 [Erwinia phage vB_EamM_Desertfox]AUG86102.1 hypothetical protein BOSOLAPHORUS_316 [Erwinia phage vB_EamM_Bosolaphorus]ANH51776.1 hypothetical protein SIMMY50_318 [Erwinia phage vB_EamM_Simmy50]ANH52418.1 hypothetical